VLGVFDMGSQTIYPGLASNSDLPDFCLLSSEDCRCELPVPDVALFSLYPVSLSTIILIIKDVLFYFSLSNISPWGTRALLHP
jgi:hypothetical protein